jgi:hypothetical protein
MRYKPIGLVIAASAMTKSASCSQPEVCIAVWLEFFRPDHGREQVSEQLQGNHAHNDIFHK